MKRFFVVLLSLGLLAVLSSPVFAANAKFSGEFFLQGWYNKNASLIDKDYAAFPADPVYGQRNLRGSSAFYTQRLRMNVDFQVAKGLMLYTGFTALDRKWMGARTSTDPNAGSLVRSSDIEAENIAWETAYAQFFTPIGLFIIGNTVAGQFGTPFNDYIGWDNPVLVYYLAKGPWNLALSMKKSQDGQTADTYGPPTGTPIGAGTDFDTDSYTLQFQYRWSTGGAGFQFTESVSNKASTIYKVEQPFSIAYVRNQFGRVFVEDEVLWYWGGKYLEYQIPGMTDVKNGLGLSNYFNINVDLAPAKLGLMFVYSAGDDPTTGDKKEGGYHTALGNDRSFNPCLILFNEDYVRWFSTGNRGSRSATANNGVILGNAGGITAANPKGNGLGTHFDNVYFYQVYGNFKLSPKLDLSASVTYAYADEKPIGFISKKYGYEADMTLKYKIYDNLEYMLGAAYFWTGDYFKGTDPNVKLADNYLITHKLTLAF